MPSQTSLRFYASPRDFRRAVQALKKAGFPLITDSRLTLLLYVAREPHEFFCGEYMDLPAGIFEWAAEHKHLTLESNAMKSRLGRTIDEERVVAFDLVASPAVTLNDLKRVREALETKADAVFA